MGRCGFFAVIVASSCLAAIASARAVNISNTWVLPEEGFPVFYRYFRDRISWYEADAVCQFHHANLVTADSTSQYDAIRAYLKELDITDNIWIGLSKTAEKPNFTWTDFEPLTNEGHWLEAIPSGDDPLCVVMNPAADFLWKPLPCGGPEVAAFICELPIPSWASGPKGCLLTELPSLTVLYIPEQSALELTSDCGLDGTKRIACKGNADREDILKQLTCTISTEEFDDKFTKSSIMSSSSGYEYETSTNENSPNDKTTKSWTSNTVDIDYGMPTRHRRETEQTLSPVSTKSSFKQIYSTTDLSWQLSQQSRLPTAELKAFSTFSTNYDGGITTESGSRSDTTLDFSVADTSVKEIQRSTFAVTTDSGLGLLTTQNAEAKVGTVSVGDVESAKAEPPPAEEYPNAVNQGQLFSIIGNGTMFDIIELNETSQVKPGWNNFTTEQEKTQNPSNVPNSTSKYKLLKNAEKFTTAASNTETLATKKLVTKKALKSPLKRISKDLNTMKTFNQHDAIKKSVANSTTVFSINQKPTVTTIDNLNKEFELIPFIKDATPNERLNRTFRKELPPIYDENDALENGSHFGVPKVINFSVSNSLSSPSQENFEIRFHEEDKDKNLTENVFVATIKRDSNEDENNKDNVQPSELKKDLLAENIETLDEGVVHKVFTLTAQNGVSTTTTTQMIDPQIEVLNKEALPQNNESEVIVPVKISKYVEERFVTETVPLSEIADKITVGSTLVTQSESTTDFNSDNSRIDSSEEAAKKPNRKRQLTSRTQRKSFYPYFFSRMLG